MSQTSYEDKLRIIERHRLHQKQADIASEMGISTSTVNYVIKNFKETGTAKRQDGSGRPHLFTERSKRLLRRIVKANRGASLEFIQLRLPFEASTWSITHELKLMEIHKHVAAKKPFLSEQHRRNKSSTVLEFAFCKYSGFPVALISQRLPYIS
ncbi:hypothetical protein G6F56_005119 [Rhizopus delemar]|nr:hypothetical protein G6F56_005119 [Rhizopus delemar]